MGPINCNYHFEIAENLTRLISEKFSSALSQKTIVYFESETQYRLGKAFRVSLTSEFSVSGFKC